jgi:hypothetical protein
LQEIDDTILRDVLLGMNWAQESAKHELHTSN